MSIPGPVPVSTDCAHCSVPSTLTCSSCSQASYCSRAHQKLDWKKHKRACRPVRLHFDTVLGNHLIASRRIKEGEVIVQEEPLLVGPRSNLDRLVRICLGCYEEVTSGYACSVCSWPLCNINCEKNSWHSKFECPYFATAGVPPASTQEEYMFVTVLRCILCQRLDPDGVGRKLEQFESHSGAQRNPSLSIQLSMAMRFLQNVVRVQDVDRKEIDFAYGILVVNGYSDTSRYSVKLYEFGSKISHACLPNTRNAFSGQGTGTEKLKILSIVPIPKGEPLTQLYCSLQKGTYQRQEALQRVYSFSCSCPRCEDPSELGTFFSAIICSSCQGMVLPQTPRILSSQWKCGHCARVTLYENTVLPALARVQELTGMSESDCLYSEFEFYSYESPDVPLVGNEVVGMKLDHILQMYEILLKVGSSLVHRNHFALLPAKTAVLATAYSIMSLVDSAAQERLLKIFLEMAKELLETSNVLQPGLTRDRGILLLYIAEGLRIQCKHSRKRIGSSNGNASTEIEEIWKEASMILSLESELDPFRQELEKCKHFYRV